MRTTLFALFACVTMAVSAQTLDATSSENEQKRVVTGRADNVVYRLGGGNLGDGISPLDFVKNMNASDVQVIQIDEEYGGDGRASGQHTLVQGRVMEDESTHVYNVRITERDADGRIISYALSNPFGNFTIDVTNPDNIIRFERYFFKDLECRASELKELVYMERIGEKPMVIPETPTMRYANPRLDVASLEFYEGDEVLAQKVKRQKSAVTVDGMHYLLDDKGHATVCYMFWTEAQGDVVIPESINYDGRKYTVTAIDGSAFWNCTKMTSVSIPKTVVSIGSCAFESCTGLKSVIIPDGVKTIGPCAFESCTSLHLIDIPRSVESIGEFAFAGCPLLIVTLDSAKKIDCPETAFDLSMFFDATLNVPKAWKESKGKVDTWHQFRKVEHLDKVYNTK